MRYLKVRNDGERFWCVDLGNGRARCDSDTQLTESPRYREEFDLDGFEIIEEMIVSMRDHLRVVSNE